MCVGLGVTTAAEYVVAGSPAIMQAIASNQILGVGALIVGIGLVLNLSARVRKMTDSRG
jgi:FtsH-binding integral membrane protein